MTYLVKEIQASDLSKCTTSSKGCTFGTDSCTLESKFGRLVINIPDGVAEVTLHTKRVSGNGKFSIVVNEEKTQHAVYSKLSQSFDVRVSGSTLKIIRPDDSTGDICILGLEFFAEESKEPDQGEFVQKWKSLIARCSGYKHLRMVGSQLFAARGAVIEGANVVRNIVTSPANVYVRENNKIVFNEPCEILDLEIEMSAPISPSTSIGTFQHMAGPMPLVAPPVPDPPDVNAQAERIRSSEAPVVVARPVTLDARVDYVMYDSSARNDFNERMPSPSENAQFVTSNRKGYLVMRRSGVWSVPISALQPNTEYVAVVTMKKLNGNGKINVGFLENKELKNSQVIHASPLMNEIHVSVKTYSGTNGGAFRLAIEMDNDGVGEVLIARVLLMENLPINRKLPTPPGRANQQKIHSPVSTETGLLSSRKRFAIVIPSYKNEKWCEKNILSTVNQNYENYRVIFTDDCSPDNTFAKVAEIVESSSKRDKFTLVRNPIRKGALANLHAMINSCDDNEIVLTLDGDDWLSNPDVLSKLNEVYSKGDVWMTYGQYENFPDGGRGIAQQIPANVVNSGSFRQYTWCASHLRTFYAWLFKEIDQKDLYYEDSFMSMTWDMAMMFPMLEMAGAKSKYINDVLYTYNLENPINDHKVNIKLQQDLDRYVRRLPRYPVQPAPVTHDMSVGLLLIATGKYGDYVQGLISSADNYFLKNMNVTYYLFTDMDHINIKTTRRVEQIPIQHRPFPFASMDRFKHFTEHAGKLSKEKYLYYVDVDCLFVDHVFTEIIGDLVGVSHCGYMNKPGPLEHDANSALFANEDLMRNYKHYYGGGFSGGKTEKYLELARWCSQNIDKDVERNIIPVWHDETAINRYFLEHEPDVVLSPSYHYPEGQINYYLAMWPTHYSPKILLLDKNHRKMRT